MSDAVFDASDLREDVEIEAKRAGGRDGKGALPKDMWETYSAFADTDGGVILDHDLVTDGQGRATSYRVAGAETVDLADPAAFTARFARSEHNPGRSEHIDRRSEHNAPRSEHITGRSEHLEVDFKRDEEFSEHSPPISDDSTQDPELLGITEAVRSKRRVSPGTTRDTILKLCEGRFLTLNELATLMDRSADGLRQRFIKPMVDIEKVLERRYPQQPNHERQAYRTRPESDE